MRTSSVAGAVSSRRMIERSNPVMDSSEASAAIDGDRGAREEVSVAVCIIEPRLTRRMPPSLEATHEVGSVRLLQESDRATSQSSCFHGSNSRATTHPICHLPDRAMVYHQEIRIHLRRTRTWFPHFSFPN